MGAINSIVGFRSGKNPASRRFHALSTWFHSLFLPRASMSGNYFIAARPPRSVTDQIDPIHRRFLPDALLSWYTGPWLIIPIRFLGPHVFNVDAAKKALYSLRVLNPAKAELGHHTTVLDHKLVYVPVYGLNGLAEETRKRTQHIGQDERHEFVGRIAVVKRNRGTYPTYPLPRIVETFHGQFDVDKFYLLQAVRDSRGYARYEVIDHVYLGHHCHKCGAECISERQHHSSN
jgi:2'-5' RNA ligase